MGARRPSNNAGARQWLSQPVQPRDRKISHYDMPYIPYVTCYSEDDRWALTALRRSSNRTVEKEGGGVEVTSEQAEERWTLRENLTLEVTCGDSRGLCLFLQHSQQADYL